VHEHLLYRYNSCSHLHHTDTQLPCRSIAAHYCCFNCLSAPMTSHQCHYQCVGFTHGGLNSDNMSVCGIALDLGSCAFIEHFCPRVSPNPTDVSGRYAFSAQVNTSHLTDSNKVLEVCYAGALDSALRASKTRNSTLKLCTSSTACV
jgi:Protein adenylyltransferase SelO